MTNLINSKLTKQNSILKYGDLTAELFVSYDETETEFNADQNDNNLNSKGNRINNRQQISLTDKLFISTEINQLKKLKFYVAGNKVNEINIHEITSEYLKQTGRRLILKNLNINQNSLEKAKAKKLSIETYGDLTAELFVSYDEEYKFNVLGKKRRKLNFEDLKAEYNKQSDTLITGDLTILNIGNVEGSLLTNIDSTSLTNAKAKKASIDTYGDLITNNLIVSFEETEFKFNVEENTNKLNFVDLKTEYNKQSDAPITGDLTILNIGNVEGSLLTNIDETTLEEAKTKAKKVSINIYGDLTAELFVLYDETDKKSKFHIGGNKENAINAKELATEYFKQTGKKISTKKQFKKKLNINQNSFNIAIRKGNSIEIYGNLRNTLFVSFNREYKFNTIEKERRKLNFFNLKVEYNKQNDIQIFENLTIENIDSLLSNIDSISLAKAKSIETYGDITTNNLIVSFEETEFKFNIEENDNKLNFVDLKTEYNKQSDTLITDDLTIENIDSFLTNIDTTTLNEAKTKSKTTSIETYGDLINGTIKIDYDGTAYTFQVEEKTKLNLVELNKQLNIQGDTEEDYTIDNLPSNIDEIQTLAKAKTKKLSFDTYGDLIIGPIKVDYENENFTFQVGDKSKLNSLAELTTQLNIQNDTATTNYTINNLSSILNFVGLEKAKAKKHSIETYGNLKTEKIKVDYDGNIFIFKIKSKKKLNIVKLNKQLNKQGDTVTTNYTINNLPSNLNFVGLEKAKAKKHSIETYGNLKTEIIKVDYYEFDYTFQVGEKPKINLETLNNQLDIQGDTVTTDYTIYNLPLTLRFIGLEKAKAKKLSIETYGDLINGRIKVDYDRNNYTFQVDQKSKLNLETLNDHLNKQGDTVNEDYTINNLPSTLNFVGVEQAKAKKAIEDTKSETKGYSIQRYGDLRTTLFVSFNREYKFNTHGKETNKLNFENLKIEYNKQSDTLITGDLTIENIDSLLSNIDETTLVNAKAKVKSIKRFGNLKIDSIEVDYDGTYYTFQVGNKTKISLIVLNQQLVKQELTEIEETTTNFNHLTGFNEESFTKAKAKKLSFETYGDLRTEIIKVDYDEFDYTFQVGSKPKISLNVLNIQLVKQGLTEINDETTDFSHLTGFNEESFTKAKAKKTSIEIYGDLKNDLIKVDYKNENYTFQINEKTELNLDTLNDQLNIQGDTVVTDYTINNLPSTLNLVDLKKAKAKKTSIETYGNLKIDSIKVDYDGTNYIFQVGEKTIISLDVLNEQLNIQRLAEINEETTDFSHLTGFNEESFTNAKTKKDSIEKLGDLTIEKIKADYNKPDYIFKIRKKRKISLYDLNEELAKQDLKEIDEATTNFNHLKNFNVQSFAKAKAKKASILKYGDLRNDPIKVDFENENFTFQFERKTKLNLVELNKQLNIQGDKTKENYTINNLPSNFVGVNQAKAKKVSIETYGDLITTLFVSFDGKYKFNTHGKETNKLNFEDLKVEYNKQSDTLITGDLTIKNIGSVKNSLLTNIDETSLAKAITKEISIKTYGNLKIDLIRVDYENENFTFQVDSKTKLNSLYELKEQLNNQGDTRVIDYTIDNLPSTSNFVGVEEAKAKKLSIETYGDLRNDRIKVDFDGTDYTFQVEEKAKLNLNTLNDQLDIQGDTVVTGYTINNLPSTLNFVGVEEAKVKKTSIETYGNLKIGPIKIDFDYGNNAYTFQVGNNTLMSLNQFNEQLNEQGSNTPHFTIENFESLQIVDKIKTLAKAKAKKLSIETFGNLKIDLIKVDYEKDDYTFQVGEKQVISLNVLNQQLVKQGLTEISEATTNFNHLTGFDVQSFTNAKIKKASILRYGDLKFDLIRVDYNGIDYIFQVGEKQVISLNVLNIQLVKQGLTEINDETTDFSHLTRFDVQSFTNAKAKKTSIETYGDLTIDPIEVDYENNAYTIQVGKKSVISLIVLNQQLVKQGLTEISEATTNFDHLKNFNVQSFTNAKAKKVSINRYGDLRNGIVKIDYENDYTFQVGSKTKLNLAELNRQLDIQGDTIEEDYTIDNLPLNIDEIKTLAKAKAKKIVEDAKAKTKGYSIETYGDLRNNLIKVDYDGTDYTFQVGEKSKLNLFYLNKQLNIQGDTEEDYTINNFGSLNIDAITLEKAKAKKNSIDTYGDLKTTLFVSFDGEYKFNAIENEANKLNFVDLKIEYNKQSDELITEDLTIFNIGNVKNSLLINIDQITLSKTKTKKTSIDEYGNLKTDPIKVDYEKDDYTFQVGEKTKLNLETLNVQLNNQGDTIVTDYTINNLPSTLNLVGLEKAKAKEAIKNSKLETKDDSIETYGDLTIGTIKIDYEENDYTFQVEEKTKLNIFNFNRQLDIQGDTVKEDYTIDTLPLNLSFVGVQKAKTEESKALHGDLINGIIKIDYDGIAYTFQVGDKSKLNLVDLNVQLNIQGDTIVTDYTIDNLPSTLNFVGLNKAKAKKTSIDEYGDLRNELIEVSYDENNFIFKIENKKKLNIVKLNRQLDIQGDTIEEDYTIDNLPSTLILFGVEEAKAKKTKLDSIRNYGDLIIGPIKVDYDGTNYTFQVGEKTKLNLAELNRQLDIQGDTVNEDYIIDNLPSNIDKIKTFAKARIKKRSIDTYGDLTTDLIVSNVGKKIKFNFKGNDNKLNTNKLNIEYQKQTGQDLKLTDIESVKNSKINLDPVSLSKLKPIIDSLIKPKKISPSSEIDNEPKTDFLNDDNFGVILGVIFGTFVLLITIGLLLKKYSKKKKEKRKKKKNNN